MIPIARRRVRAVPTRASGVPPRPPCSMPSADAESAQSQALHRFFQHHFPARSEIRSVLSIRAHAPDGLTSFAPADVSCLQTHRTLSDALQRHGFRICAAVDDRFDLCVVEATKYKEENLFHVALAWSSLRPGGHLILSAANTLGGESLAKRLSAALPVQGVWSLAKCRIVWLTRAADGPLAEPLATWLALGDYRLIPGTALYSCPGVFSPRAVDAGTRLLCDCLPLPLAGHGADFGCGYGALSRHILKHSESVRRLDLYDVEKKALAAAELNLAPFRERCAIQYHWADVPRANATQHCDWIVMNPPFHAGRAAVPALGKAFIEAALAHLKAGGTLWLVANRHLPYEAVLRECFGDAALLCDRGGFKVYRARHPGMPRSHPAARGP